VCQTSLRDPSTDLRSGVAGMTKMRAGVSSRSLNVSACKDQRVRLQTEEQH
jgi:hypothetical protein